MKPIKVLVIAFASAVLVSCGGSTDDPGESPSPTPAPSPTEATEPPEAQGIAFEELTCEDVFPDELHQRFEADNLVLNPDFVDLEVQMGSHLDYIRQDLEAADGFNCIYTLPEASDFGIVVSVSQPSTEIWDHALNWIEAEGLTRIDHDDDGVEFWEMPFGTSPFNPYISEAHHYLDGIWVAVLADADPSARNLAEQIGEHLRGVVDTSGAS